MVKHQKKHTTRVKSQKQESTAKHRASPSASMQRPVQNMAHDLTAAHHPVGPLVAIRRIEGIYAQRVDGSPLLLRRVVGGKKRAVIVLPDIHERATLARYERLQALANSETTMYFWEPSASEKLSSIKNMRLDIVAMLEFLHEHFRAVYVVATGLSASMVLEHEGKGSLIRGMVLIQPRLRVHKRSLFKRKAAYELQPVRIQAPTIIFSDTAGTEPLHRIFGPVRLRAMRHWQDMEFAQHVKDALRAVEREEPPIRFSIER